MRPDQTRGTCEPVRVEYPLIDGPAELQALSVCIDAIQSLCDTAEERARVARYLAEKFA